jgi:hypothetical protein
MKLFTKPKDYKKFIDSIPIIPQLEPCVMCVLVEDFNTYDYHIIHTSRSIYEMFEDNEMSIRLRGSSQFNIENQIKAFNVKSFLVIGKILIIDSRMDVDNSPTILLFQKQFFRNVLKTFNRNRIINNILSFDI